MTAESYHSQRLVYRAIEPDAKEDIDLFLVIQQDPLSYQNANSGTSRPQSSSDAKAYMKFATENTQLAVVMCLPASDPDTKDVPIGVIHLDKLPPHQAHHRRAEIGLQLLRAYQSKGYGGEAIRWVLQWAFMVAGLHRVMTRAHGWNERALKLYERLGFKPEGSSRENSWFQGRWWDDPQFGMLESEWRAMQVEEST